QWSDLFTPRQLVGLGTFVNHTRKASPAIKSSGYDGFFAEAILSYLACGLDRLVDFANVNTQWKVDVPTINHALIRFAIQITWDFAEGNPVGSLAGGYQKCIERIATGIDTLGRLPSGMIAPQIIKTSAAK